MYTSIPVVFVTALALIVLIRNDINSKNNHETLFHFCHGFTTTTIAPVIHQDRLYRRNSILHLVPKTSSSLLSVDDDVQMDITTTITATTTTASRRDLMSYTVKSVVAMTTAVMIHSSSIILPALASGGATAGRYT